LKITEKTSAYRLKSARTFGVAAVSVCTALISLTPSIAQASQSPTSSKARNDLATFVSFYDLFVNPCFKDLNSGIHASLKGDWSDSENAFESLPGDCSMSTGLLRTTSVPTKTYPSLMKIDSLTASWISDARIIAQVLDLAAKGKKSSPVEETSYKSALKTIDQVRAQIFKSIQVAITASKSHSIGSLPSIPRL
jgi:hypothetical protein